jgi:hypothetical protein
MPEKSAAEKQVPRKPEFVKIKDIENGRSGYNVYVKVLEVKDHEILSKDDQSQKMDMIDVLVADETGAARAFFKGEQTKDIVVGVTIAIRNGARKIIKNRISLEVDLFGRVTVETVDIKPNTGYNISDVEVKQEPKTYNKRPWGKFGGRRELRGGYQDRRFERRDDYRDYRRRKDRRDDWDDKDDRDDRDDERERDDRYDQYERRGKYERGEREGRGERYRQYGRDERYERDNQRNTGWGDKRSYGRKSDDRDYDRR